jgi:hypothetical protein
MLPPCIVPGDAALIAPALEDASVLALELWLLLPPPHAASSVMRSAQGSVLRNNTIRNLLELLVGKLR